MPRPALMCEEGLLKVDFDFQGTVFRHVQPDATARVWRCCADDGIYCGEALVTPHVPVPEPPMCLAILAGLLLIGVMYERARRRREKRRVSRLREP